MVIWASQGEISDRSSEKLAATDEAIVRFRSLLAEQIDLVEAGGVPMNVFSADTYDGRMLELEPRIGAALDREAGDATLGKFRSLYHEGYYIDDHDRYGPALEQMIELMRATSELAENRRAQSSAVPA
jgi:5,5'-dehydrodivanillate O-demethylase